MSTVKLSVSGLKSEFHRDILQGRQHQKLPQLVSDAVKQGTPLEFSFDRPSGMFTYILAYYQSGELHMPTCVCPGLFEKELNFWGIDAEELSQCCYFRYTRFLNDCETQRKFKKETMFTGSTGLSMVPVMPKGGVAGFCDKVWRVVDNSSDTLAAKITKGKTYTAGKIKSEGFKPFNAIDMIRTVADDIDQDQTVQNVQSDLGSILSACCVKPIYFGAVVSMIVLSIISLALSTEPSMRRSVNKCELIEYLEYTNFHEIKFIEVALGNPTCTWDAALSNSEEIKVDDYDWQRLWNDYVDSSNNDKESEENENDDSDEPVNDMNDHTLDRSNDNIESDISNHPEDTSKGNTTDDVKDHKEDSSNSNTVDDISGHTEDTSNGNTAGDIIDHKEDSNNDSTEDDKSGHTEDTSNETTEDDASGHKDDTSNDNIIDDIKDHTEDSSNETAVEDIRNHNEESSNESSADDVSHHNKNSSNESTADDISQHTEDSSNENTVDDIRNHTEGTSNNTEGAEGDINKHTEHDTDDHSVDDRVTGKPKNNSSTTVKSAVDNITKEGNGYLSGVELTNMTDLRNSSFNRTRSVVPIPRLTVPVYTLDVLENIAMALFTVDFFIRLFSCPSLKRYFLSFLNVIDACALVSSYIYVIVLSIQRQYRYEKTWVHTLEYLQIFRVFRLFRVVQNVRTTKVLVYSVSKNLRDVSVIALLLLLAVAIFSTVFFFTEEKTTVDSIPEAWYWAIVTLTTVGYGDLSPKTYPGRLIASLCAVCGIMILVVTLQIFVNNFLVYYDISCVEEANEVRKSKHCTTSGFARDVSINDSSKKAVEEQETKVVVLTCTPD